MTTIIVVIICNTQNIILNETREMHFKCTEKKDDILTLILRFLLFPGMCDVSSIVMLYVLVPTENHIIEVMTSFERSLLTLPFVK